MLEFFITYVLERRVICLLINVPLPVQFLGIGCIWRLIVRELWLILVILMLLKEHPRLYFGWLDPIRLLLFKKVTWVFILFHKYIDLLNRGVMFVIVDIYRAHSNFLWRAISTWRSFTPCKHLSLSFSWCDYCLHVSWLFAKFHNIALSINLPEVLFTIISWNFFNNSSKPWLMKLSIRNSSTFSFWDPTLMGYRALSVRLGALIGPLLGHVNEIGVLRPPTDAFPPLFRAFKHLHSVWILLLVLQLGSKVKPRVRIYRLETKFVLRGMVGTLDPSFIDHMPLDIVIEGQVLVQEGVLVTGQFIIWI